MISSGELVELIENYIDDKKELVLILNELIETIQHNPNSFCYDLSQECEDIADGNFCPLCTSNLEYHTYREESEYFGQPTYESITVAECENPSCGYTTQD